MELKKLLRVFLNVCNVLHVLNMSHGNGSSAFASQVMGFFVTNYRFCGPGATTFAHEVGRVPLTLWVKF